MRRLTIGYDTAVAAIDDANAADPTTVVFRGEPTPLALAQGRLATAWVERLVPDAPEALRLAARAHHLRRWELPRTSYPEGRAGYLRWRRDQKLRHARDVEALLVGAGFEPPTIERVQALIRRDGLASDPDAQSVEDAACLVFFELQLGTVTPQLERGRLVEVLAKTLAKMSAAGRAAAAGLPLSASERALLDDVLSNVSPPRPPRPSG